MGEALIKTNIDENFLIKVADSMSYPRPRLKRKVFCLDDEWLPLISITVDH